jgi:hypothetical protein
VRTAALYCQGKSQEQIAEVIGVSRVQIGNDLRRILERWTELAVGQVMQRRSEECAKLLHLEAVAWDAWERSCTVEERTTQTRHEGSVVETTTSDDAAEPSKPATKRTTRVSTSPHSIASIQKLNTQGVGDPRFLTIIQRCIEQRATLLGLNVQTNLDLTDKIRRLAEQRGLDPDVALSHAASIVQDLARSVASRTN